jgi:1-pyrroline-5-carboxylate dehydrogenase
VGNLYFNRKCTGALVGVHPFGGFNMSGTDSKAGGRDYLLLFLQAKVVSEQL